MRHSLFSSTPDSTSSNANRIAALYAPRKKPGGDRMMLALLERDRLQIDPDETGKRVSCDQNCMHGNVNDICGND